MNLITKQAYVLDCSITMAWIFKEEETPYTNQVKDLLKSSIVAHVPSIWSLEVANVLYCSERKGRITEADSAEFRTILQTLPIIIDHTTSTRALESILNLAREQRITVYDAAYLELAMREGFSLATLDNVLKKAAEKVGISIF